MRMRTRTTQDAGYEGDDEHCLLNLIQHTVRESREESKPVHHQICAWKCVILRFKSPERQVGTDALEGLEASKWWKRSGARLADTCRYADYSMEAAGI